MDLYQKSLSLEEFLSYYQRECPVIDTRPIDHLTNGYIRSALAIPPETDINEWLSKLIGHHQPFLLIDHFENLESTLHALDESFKDQLYGYLRVGIEGWLKAEQPMDLLICIDNEELMLDYKHDADIKLLDVRTEEEYRQGHLKNALNIPVDNLPNNLSYLAKEDKLYVYSQFGHLSVIAATLLKKSGFYYTKMISSGFADLQETEIPVVQ